MDINPGDFLQLSGVLSAPVLDLHDSGRISGPSHFHFESQDCAEHGIPKEGIKPCAMTSERETGDMHLACVHSRQDAVTPL